jgi:hypothetical protein
LREIIEKSFKPIILINLFLAIITILEFYNFFKSIDLNFIDELLDIFSLNKNDSIGVWFNVFLWIICGISFVMLGLKKTGIAHINSKSRVTLLIIGIMISIVSLEKIFHFHLMFEFRAINLLGFFSADMRKDSPFYWFFLILIPVFLFILFGLLFALYKLLNGIESKSSSKKIALSYLVTALLCIPLNVLFDIIQGYFWYAGQRNTIFNSIEAIFEVMGLICFIGFNKTVANYYFMMNQFSKS